MSIRWVLSPLELLAQAWWCLLLGVHLVCSPLETITLVVTLLKMFEGSQQRLGAAGGGGHSLPLPGAPPPRLQLSEATAGHLEVGSRLLPTAAKVFCLRAPGGHPAPAEPVRGGTRSFTVTFTLVQRRGTNCPSGWKVAHRTVFLLPTLTQARGPIPVPALGTHLCTRAGHGDRGHYRLLFLQVKQLPGTRILASSEEHGEICPPRTFLQQR